MPTAKSQTVSLALHAALLGIVFLLTWRPIETSRARWMSVRVLNAPVPWRSTSPTSPRSGGSNRTSLAARKGAPPPKSLRTFIPPKTLTDPKLPLAVTIAFDSPTIQIDPASIGDPFSQLRSGALGNRGGEGIGDAFPGTGVGPEGAGPPGIGSVFHGSRVTSPVLIYKQDPEFSEEARKAKYQGTVLLTIEVDTGGHARNIRVARGLGLGLDEKAIEAVSHWLFRPGLRDGKAVVTSATIEVNFRLL